MANTETWGQYLRVEETTTTTITVTWSSLAESGNQVTDAYWNLELFKYPESNDNLIWSSYRVPLGYRRWAFTPANGAPVLQPDTFYIVKLYANRQNDRAVDRIYVQTAKATNPTPGTPSLNVSNSGTTIYLSGSGDSNTNSITLTGPLSPTTETISGSGYYSSTRYGSWGGYYTFSARANGTYGNSGTVSRSIQLPPAMPTNFNIYDRSATELAFAWNVASGASTYSLEVYNYPYTSGVSNMAYRVYGLTGRTHWATGLIQGNRYNVKLFAVTNGANSTPTWLNDVRAGFTRPSNFSWTITKANNRAYNRNSLGQLTNFMSADELTSFQSRINEFREYKGLSRYTFTAVGPGMELTASIYNQLRTAISSMNPSTSLPPSGSSGTGDVVNKLNGLVSSLNSVS